MKGKKYFSVKESKFLKATEKERRQKTEDHFLWRNITGGIGETIQNSNSALLYLAIIFSVFFKKHVLFS